MLATCIDRWIQRRAVMRSRASAEQSRVGWNYGVMRQSRAEEAAGSWVCMHGGCSGYGLHGIFFRRKLGSNVPLGGTSTTLGNIGKLYPQWPSLSRLESTRTPESTPQVQKPSRRYICKWLALAASKRFGKFDWGDDDAKSLRMRGPCTCTLAVCYYSSTTHYYQRRRHESACFDPQVDRAGLTLVSARFRTASATMHIVHA